MLDTVLDDLNALDKRVGTADRARLDQHTESIRAIERRLRAPTRRRAGAACAQPDRRRPRSRRDRNSNEPLAERMDAMSDLLALALSCDLSRVFSIQFSGSAAGPVFWQVGADRGHHDLSHDGASSQDDDRGHAPCSRWSSSRVWSRKFRDTPDGAGNLLDSLALLATSDHSDGAAHTVNDYPVLIAGRAGGALVHPGVHYASNERAHQQGAADAAARRRRASSRRSATATTV